ncbi:MAG: UDP-N-acetylmuramoyl-tripeptide--D-alanyl-D-alanine ligase [Mariprofundus sp.]|nr:UDP-N-acetylmuramoyl-tripeptide--D-alanyl-D-alanine ligase [Mariprofundus sp.]
MQLSGAEIGAATRGVWHGKVPAAVNGVCTDSRRFQAGNVFLALRGPHFDGHAFAASVDDNAVALIGDREGMRRWFGLENSRLEVEDTLQALGDIAHAWRNKLTDTCVIAISGSYGKTSLRSMLECGFAALGFKTAATRANLNNLIGVPATLLAVPADADIAVIECGISERGEMARLAAMVQPDIAVLTGITAAHSQGLGGLDGVVREKSLLPQSLREHGWCALGEGVAALMQSHQITMQQTCFSVDDASNGDTVNWRLDGCELDGYELRLNFQDQHSTLRLALPAAHWAANFAFAASIILRYLQEQGKAPELARVVNGLKKWQPLAGRMQRRSGGTGAVVLDDSYNANPVSMQAAIDTLRALPGNKIAILGDMAELGEAMQAAHAGLDVAGLDMIYLIGPHMQALAEKYPASCWFASTEDALNALAGITFKNGDAVLVKASRSMHLDSVVELLCSGELTHAV